MTYGLVSVVLPVHRQATHIGSIVEEYERALGKVSPPHELILVVNGSPDASFEACHALTQRYPAVRAVCEKEAGWGLAVRRGLREASGDLLCYTNSARTSAQDLVLLILYAVANPGIVVKANRKIRENWRRRLGSLLYNLECRTLFDLSYWDINGTPKVFPRSCDKLLGLSRNDDLIDLEFNVICRREEYRILEVPIFSHRRQGGSSTTGYRSAIRMFAGAYRMSRTYGSG